MDRDEVFSPEARPPLADHFLEGRPLDERHRHVDEALNFAELEDRQQRGAGHPRPALGLAAELGQPPRQGRQRGVEDLEGDDLDARLRPLRLPDVPLRPLPQESQQPEGTEPHSRLEGRLGGGLVLRGGPAPRTAVDHPARGDVRGRPDADPRGDRPDDVSDIAAEARGPARVADRGPAAVEEDLLQADLRDGDHSSDSAPGRSRRRRGQGAALLNARPGGATGRAARASCSPLSTCRFFAVDRGRPLIGGIRARTIANRVEAEARSRLIQEAMGPHER